MDIKFNLTEIRKYVGNVMFERGMEYYSENMIHSIVQMGHLVKGRSQGSMPYSYFVQIEFNIMPNGTTGIKQSKCSCPMRDQCKHVAALLITFYRKPEASRNQSELVKYFSNQTKEWLIDLLLELGEKDSDTLERFFKIKDGKARRTRKSSGRCINL